MQYQYFASIGFSFCALLFIVLIIFMYSRKEKYKNIENTLFILLLATTIFLIADEFIYAFGLYRANGGEPAAWAKFFCYVFLSGNIIWMGMFIYYMLVQCTRKYEREVKDRLRKIILYIEAPIVLVFATIGWVYGKLNFHTEPDHILNFSDGATNIGYIFGAIVIIVIIYWLVTTSKGMTTDQKKPLILAVVIVVGSLALQFFVQEADYNIQCFQYAIILMALFFTLENQDNRLLIDREKSKEEAEKVNAAQTQFLTSMSHEIRTPMSTIMGFSEALLMDKEVTEEEVKKDTKYIHAAAITLLDLINNILDLSRIDSEKEQVVEQEYSLKESLLEISEAMNAKTENKNVNFEMKINEELPQKYVGDAPKINKIILNLLSYLLNKGEIRNITLNVDQYKTEGDEFTFYYSILIAANLLVDEFKILTDEYENIQDNKVNNDTLGLLVAKRYINMLNGNSSISSTEDYIKYDIYIQQQVSDPAKIGNIFAEIKNIENVKLNLEGKKILVVDDNPINIKLISRLLGEYNPQVDSCISGIECIEKVQSNNYDLIFLDHMMPGLDGIETLKRMKDLMPKIPPVVALTANSYSGAREKYKSDGFYDYLAKPFNVNDLKNLLVSIFNK